MEVYTTSNKRLGEISIRETATVKDIKKEIAKIAKFSVERQSVRAEQKGKDQKDTATADDLNVRNTKKIFVKDLGPQIGWDTVFIIEYTGPLVLYAAAALRPWLLYGSSNENVPFSTTALYANACDCLKL